MLLPCCSHAARISQLSPFAAQRLQPPKTALDQAMEYGFAEVVATLRGWENLQTQERIKEEFPETASNYITSNFVTGSELRLRTVAN